VFFSHIILVPVSSSSLPNASNATLIAWLTGRPTCPPFPLCGSRGNRASRDALEGGEDAPRGGRWIGYLDVRSLPEPDSSFLAGSCGCFTNRASKVEAGGQWRRAVVARVRHVDTRPELVVHGLGPAP